MSAFQNKSLQNKIFGDLNLSDNFKNFTSKLSTKNVLNIQDYNRKEYIKFIFSSIFKEDFPADLGADFSALFFEYLECENKFFFRDKINAKLKMLLHQKFHNDINKFSLVLQKIQYIINNIEFDNLQFKVDLCRIERFFMNLILRRYTDNLVRGHRRIK
jgi:hypothetical protein